MSDDTTMNNLLSIGLVLALVDKVTAPLKGITDAVTGIGKAADGADLSEELHEKLFLSRLCGG
ncbi:MAG: hypothetical protein RBQ99_10600 [Trichlorobacter sp.]|nr:hypothetical protein [Trichlorobacter sp.]